MDDLLLHRSGWHDWLYRQRSLLAAGMTLPGSSDRPVVAGAPLLGVHDMVNRRTADMVVLSEDPTAVSPERIADIQVLATFVDGQCRYDSGAVAG